MSSRSVQTLYRHHLNFKTSLWRRPYRFLALLASSSSASSSARAVEPAFFVGRPQQHISRRSLWTVPTHANPSFQSVVTSEQRTFRCMTTDESSCNDKKNTDPALDKIIEETTRNWVENTIVKLNLCPFAKRPLQTNQLHIDIVHGTDEEEILLTLYANLLARTKNPGTALLVCPDVPSFEEFLSLYQMAEAMIQDDDLLEAKVQVAPFHPRFQFEGSQPDGVDNWTNRSPYPIFHVIRETDVSKAVQSLGGDAGKVWKRNVALLEALDEALGGSKAQLEQLIQGQQPLSENQHRDKVQKLLQEFESKQF